MYKNLQNFHRQILITTADFKLVSALLTLFKVFGPLELKQICQFTERNIISRIPIRSQGTPLNLNDIDKITKWYWKCYKKGGGGWNLLFHRLLLRFWYSRFWYFVSLDRKHFAQINAEVLTFLYSLFRVPPGSIWYVSKV